MKVSKSYHNLRANLQPCFIFKPLLHPCRCNGRAGVSVTNEDKIRKRDVHISNLQPSDRLQCFTLTTLIQFWDLVLQCAAVRTCNNILRVSGEGAVPHPASGCFSRIIALDAELCHQWEIGRPPDLTRLVCRAGGQQPGGDDKCKTSSCIFGGETRGKLEKKVHSRGIGAELAAEGIAFVCRDLGLGNELSHFIPDASSEVPHITVSL